MMHLLGTLHTNRKVTPCEVISAKLKKPDLASMESSRRIKVLKWDDKRNVTLLSSALAIQMKQSQSPGAVKQYQTTSCQ
jgi:hypothetical protein